MKKFLLLLFTLLFAVMNTWAADWYVATTGSNTTGNGSSGSPWQTITYAVSHASVVDGDVIYIDAGTYTENFSVGKSLTFIGSGPASEPTTTITSTVNPVISLSVSGKSFNFQNLIVQGSGNNRGIRAGSTIDISSFTLLNVIVRNCDYGVYFSEYYSGGNFLPATVNNLSFNNVTLINNAYIGAYIGKSVASGLVINSTISNNGFGSVDPNVQKVGLQFVDFNGSVVPHVTVTDCIFDNNGTGPTTIEKTGLSFYTATNTTSTLDLLTVTDCDFSNHPQYAVRIRNGYNVGNTATVNGTFTNNWLDIWFSNLPGGTTSSTTLVRYTQDGIRTVGAGPTYSYSTIQAAVNAASVGDVVLVADGTYNENVTINKNISLKSVNGAAVTIIDGLNSGSETGTLILTSGRDGVTIGAAGQGFTIKGIDGAPGLEKAAIYLQGTQSNISIVDNIIEARGDAGLTADYNAANNNITISDNDFTGKTFLGDNPAGVGFGAQFTLPNVPRQLIVMGGGPGATNSNNITFTNNTISGIAGGMSITDDLGNPIPPTPQGNTMVTLDLAGTNTITGNIFSGTTTRYAEALRVRGPGSYTITGNNFNGSYPVNMTAGTSTASVGIARIAAAWTSNTFLKGVVVKDAGSNVKINSIQTYIQAGIGLAAATDIVEVKPGTYVESLSIDKALTVNGADGAILDGTGLGNITGVSIKSGNVTFNNIDVVNFGGNGIICGYEASTPGNLPNIHITNCLVANIQPGSSHGFGIYVGYEGEGFGNGKLTGHLDYTGLIISGNEITNTAQAALVLQSITGTSGNPLQVSSNEIHGSGASGIWIDGARELSITDNDIYSNSNGFFFSAIGDGWYIENGTTGPKNISISGNDIYNNSSNGVAFYAGWPNTISVNSNKIYSNAIKGIDVTFSITSALDAENNYWGTVVATEVAAKVSGNVDYDPWCNEDFSVCGYTASSNVLNQTQGTYFLTIQDAIDAADDFDVIVVSAGTYPEYLTIYKPLTLLGPNNGLHGTSTSRTSEAVIQFPDDQLWVLIYVVSDDVTIDGFTISDAGTETSTDVFTAIYSNAVENIEIQNNIFTGFSYPTLLLTGGAYPASSSISGIDVINNYFTDNHGLYHTIYLMGVGGSVTGNVVEDCAAAIQIQPYAQPNGGTVNNNEFAAYVNGIYYNYADKGAGTWTITENTVTVADAPAGTRGASNQISSKNLLNLSPINDEASRSGVNWSGLFLRTYGNSGQGNAPQVSFYRNTINGDAISDPYWEAFWAVRIQNINANAISTFSENFFYDTDFGIKVYPDAAVDNATFFDNAFIDNTSYVSKEGTGDLNITCNWWGTISEATISAGMTGSNIVYEPWLMDGTDSEPATPGFQPEELVCYGGYPVWNQTTGDEYTNVQDAIIAANIGDVIIVTGEHNVTTITVNKGLKIAAGKGGAKFNGLGSRAGEGFIVDIQDPNQTVTFGDDPNEMIIENWTTGILVAATNTANVVISGVKFQNNTTAVSNLTTAIVEAEYNYWGAANGPLDASDDRATGGLWNPLGDGNPVSDRVDYQPWFTDAGLENNGIDIWIENPSCATLEVWIESETAISENLANVLFSIMWDQAEYDDAFTLVTDPLDPLYPEYGIQLQYYTTNAGKKYAVFGSGDAVPVTLDAGVPQKIMTLYLKQTADKFSTTDFEVAQDAFATSIYAEYYFELYATNERTGLISGFADDVYTSSCDLELDARVMLQGPYDATANTMKTDVQALLPAAQPFNVFPFSYTGTEQLPSPLPATVVDWVLIGLRDGVAETADDFRAAGLLHNDGTIRGVDGNLISFQNPALMPNTNYYAVVYHRNHMPVMSANYINIPNTGAYDFRVLANGYTNDAQAPLIELETGVYGMIAGDYSDYTLDETPNPYLAVDHPHNGQLKYSAGFNDRGPILQRISKQVSNPYINSVATGYFNQDLSMNQQVKYSGSGNDPRLIIDNLIALTGTTSLTAFYTSKVPGWAGLVPPLKSGEGNNGPLDVLLTETPQELQVVVRTSETLYGGLTDNIQFTLCWDEANTSIPALLGSYTSDFKLEPQGEAVTSNGKIYQIFAMVDGIPVPDPLVAGSELTVLRFVKNGATGNVSGKVSVAQDGWTALNNGEYYMSIWGLDRTGKILQNAVGISDPEGETALAVYPNPVTRGMVYVTLTTSVSERLTVTVADISGRTVLRQAWSVDAGSTQTLNLNLEGLAKGAYTLSVTGASTQARQRIIIQ